MFFLSKFNLPLSINILNLFWVLHGIKYKFKNMLGLESWIQNSGGGHTYKNIHLYIQGNGHMIFMTLSSDSTIVFR